MARGKQEAPEVKQAEIDPEAALAARLSTAQVGAPKGDSKKDVPTLTIAELTEYAPMSRLENEIKSWREGDGGKPIRDAAWAHYIREGVELGFAPPNIKGVDGNNIAIAAIPLRSKDDRSKIDPEDAARFQALGIRLARKEYAPTTIRMKPDVYRNGGVALYVELLDFLANSNEVTAMVQKHTGLKSSDDLFEIQRDQFGYACVGKETLNDIFAKAKAARAAHKQGEPISNETPWDDAMVRELLQKVCSPTITVQQWFGEMSGALPVARTELCPTAEDIAAKTKRDAERAAAKAKPGAAEAAKPVPPEPILAAASGRSRRK